VPPLTALDIVVLLLVTLGAVLGALRGFVHEVLSLFAWVAGAIALKLFYTPVSTAAARWVGTEAGGAVLAFALVFIVTYAAFKFLAGVLGARTRTSVVGPIDRFLGFGFGALKGLLGATILFLAINLGYDSLFGGDEPKPKWLMESRTHALLSVTSRMIVDFVDQDDQPGDADGYGERAREALDALIPPPAPKQ
jgi:membrane protein required for colicin V production